MPLGTLRHQLHFPAEDQQLSDWQIKNMLAEVGLADLVEKMGGLGVERDWLQVCETQIILQSILCGQLWHIHD